MQASRDRGCWCCVSGHMVPWACAQGEGLASGLALNGPFGWLCVLQSFTVLWNVERPDLYKGGPIQEAGCLRGEAVPFRVIELLCLFQPHLPSLEDRTRSGRRQSGGETFIPSRPPSSWLRWRKCCPLVWICAPPAIRSWSPSQNHGTAM